MHRQCKGYAIKGLIVCNSSYGGVLEPTLISTIPDKVANMVIIIKHTVISFLNIFSYLAFSEILMDKQKTL